MRKFLLMTFLFFCSVSFAETNSVDLSETNNLLSQIFDTLDAVDTRVSDIYTQVGTTSGLSLKHYVNQINSSLSYILLAIRNPDYSGLPNNSFQQIRNLLRDVSSSLTSVNNALSSVESSLRDIAGDTPNIEYQLEQCRGLLEEVCYSKLASIQFYLEGISQNVASLPAIEAYQQSLALLVSNINQLVSGNLNINFPNPFNVNVQNINDINFNPAWSWQDMPLGGSSDFFYFASPFSPSGLDSTYDLLENSTISTADTLGGSLGSINNNISEGLSLVTQWQSKNIGAISNIYASLVAYLSPDTVPTSSEIERYNQDKEKIPSQSDIDNSHDSINTDSSTLTTDLDNLDGELGRLLPNNSPFSVAPILPSSSPSELQDEYTVANITPFEFGNTKSRGTTPLTFSTRNTSSMFKGCRLLMTLIFWCAGAGLFMWGFRFVMSNFALFLNTVTGGGLSEIQKGLVNISGNWGIDMPLDAIE